MYLGQMVERARLFWIWQKILSALVLYLYESFLNSYIGRSVLSHRSQFYQMNGGILLCNGVKHVQVADYVVVLGVDGMLAVDH